MEKVLIISKEVILDLNEQQYESFFASMIKFKEKNQVILLSNDPATVKIIDNRLIDKFVARSSMREFLKENKKESNYFMVLGNDENDFRLAVNNKLMLLVPDWVKRIDHGPKTYGNIVNLKQIFKVLATVNNQNTWFYELELEDGTNIYSLTSAHSKVPMTPTKMTLTEQEVTLIKGFEDLLKRNNHKYLDVLYYHFISAISNLSVFKEVNYWTVFPTSDLAMNEDLEFFKEKSRVQMGCRLPRIPDGENKNILIRNKIVAKSHHTDSSLRRANGCEKHFDSINLNPYYKGKLEGKVVCVIDDYLNHGSSFEVSRNLLKKAGVRKVICVSLGRFKNNYLQRNFEISGDLYAAGKVNYKKIESIDHPVVKNDLARKEVENLYDIFSL